MVRGETINGGAGLTNNENSMGNSESAVLCSSAEAERILRITPHGLAAGVRSGDIPVAARLHPKNTPLFNLSFVEKLAGELRFAAIRASKRN